MQKTLYILVLAAVAGGFVESSLTYAAFHTPSRGATPISCDTIDSSKASTRAATPADSVHWASSPGCSRRGSTAGADSGGVLGSVAEAARTAVRSVVYEHCTHTGTGPRGTLKFDHIRVFGLPSTLSVNFKPSPRDQKTPSRPQHATCMGGGRGVECLREVFKAFEPEVPVPDDIKAELREAMKGPAIPPII